MRLITRITMIEEVPPEKADEMRQAFMNDTIKEDARVSMIQDMTTAIDVAPEDVMVAFKLEEEDE